MRIEVDDNSIAMSNNGLLLLAQLVFQNLTRRLQCRPSIANADPDDLENLVGTSLQLNVYLCENFHVDGISSFFLREIAIRQTKRQTECRFCRVKHSLFGRGNKKKKKPTDRAGFRGPMGPRAPGLPPVKSGPVHRRAYTYGTT